MKTTSTPIPAIVLGCHKIGLGIIRGLGSAGVPVVAVYYNPYDMGYVSKYVIARCRCPRPDHEPRAFLEALHRLSERWRGGVLIPSDDASLMLVSKNREALSLCFTVAAPPWDITECCLVKQHTYELAYRIGVPAPRMVVPSSSAEALDFADAIGFPCLIKPCVSHSFFERFRKKMFMVRSRPEFNEAYRTAQESGLAVMVQEFIPGDETAGANYNSFFVNGRPIIEVTAEKVRLSPRNTGFPTVVRSVLLPQIMGPARRLLGALMFNGFSCTEFKRDARDNVYKLMEINPRLNLSSPLSAAAGCNFTYDVYRYALDNTITPKTEAFREGMFWIDGEKDTIEFLKGIFSGHAGISAFLHPYLRPHTSALFAFDDPFPAAKRVLDFAARLMHRNKHVLNRKGKG